MLYTLARCGLTCLLIIFLSSCQGDNDSSTAKDTDTRTDDRHMATYKNQNAQDYFVSSLGWGSMSVDVPNGKTQTFKDGIVWWSGAQAWDWQISDVHHNPGITVQALQQLLDIPEITDIILTRGMEGILKVPEATVEKAIKAGKRVHIAFTREAVELYNKLLKEGKKVGGLFHTTC